VADVLHVLMMMYHICIYYVSVCTPADFMLVNRLVREVIKIYKVSCCYSVFVCVDVSVEEERTHSHTHCNGSFSILLR
jgi:hypothetical protein